MSDVYIQNIHVAGINVKSADGSLKKRFNIAEQDRISGRQVESGYTRLTKAEYEKLLAESKLFQHFIKLKLLVVHTELPPGAQTPHEALVGARKEIVKREKRIETLEAQNKELQGKLEAVQKDYKTLAAADSGAAALEKKSAELAEALKAGESQAAEITGLRDQAEADKATIEGKDEEIEKLTKELDDAKELIEAQAEQIETLTAPAPEGAEAGKGDEKEF
jgi:chromosome segregation ATPase